MGKWVRRGALVLGVSALLPVVGGVAGAVPAPQVKELDGYRVTLSLEDVAIQSVPNMAAAPLVRESFITATSKLNVVCTSDQGSGQTGAESKIHPVDSACKDNPITEAKLSMTAQVGCPLDLSSGVTTGLSPEFTSSLPFQGILQSILPPPTPTPTPGPTDLTDIAIAPDAQITPQAQVNLLPGYIRDVSLGDMGYPADQKVTAPAASQLNLAQQAADLIPKESASTAEGPAKTSGADTIKSFEKRAVALFKPLGGDPLVISVQNFHMEVDQAENNLAICGGVVAVRIYAQATITTAKSYATVDIYGDIYTI